MSTNFDPKGLSAPAPCYIHMMKLEENVLKSNYILGSNKNTYFNFGVILNEKRSVLIC